MLLKKLLRSKIQAERKAFNKEKAIWANQEIEKSIKELLISIFNWDDIIGFYSPVRGEPDLQSTIEEYKTWACLPRVQGVGMDFYRFNGFDQLEESEIKGLMQPGSKELMKPNIVILPGFAFSVNGYRLGAGFGHFDRYFYNNSGRSIIKIGVCFHEYLYESLPKEAHDIRLDYIVTDKTIIVL